MQVFLSWSKPRSKALATALRGWLPDVIQAVRPWMSDMDIDKGQTWFTEISGTLSKTSYCLLCITPENRREPWLLFEAGIAANVLTAQRVAPVLLDMHNALEAPLGVFQTTMFEKEDMYKLVRSINGVIDSPLSETTLRRAFDLHWPHLAEQVSKIEAPKEPVQEPSEKELLREILAGVRGLQRRDVRRYVPSGQVDRDIERILSTLTPAEEGVLRLRFGLHGTDPEKGPDYWVDFVKQALAEEEPAESTVRNPRRMRIFNETQAQRARILRELGEKKCEDE